MIPTPVCVVQSAMPQAEWFRAEVFVRHFEHDAAHILFGEEVAPGELEVIQRAFGVEEIGIAPPARKEAIITSVCHSRLLSSGDRRKRDDSLPAVAFAGCLFAFNTAHRSKLISFSR